MDKQYCLLCAYVFNMPISHNVIEKTTTSLYIKITLIMFSSTHVRKTL